MRLIGTSGSIVGERAEEVAVLAADYDAYDVDEEERYACAVMLMLMELMLTALMVFLS